LYSKQVQLFTSILLLEHTTVRHEVGNNLKNKGRIDLMDMARMVAMIVVALVANEAAAQVSPEPKGPVSAASLTSLLYKPMRLVYRQTEGEGFRKPTGVFVDRESGEVVVADSGSNLVTLLSRDGVPLYSFGYNGEIPQPSQAVLDKKGRILVLAGVPRKVKVFSYRGEPLGDFDYPGFDGASKALPTALTVDQAGNFYVADSTSSRILVYNLDGRLVGTIGKRGDGPGAFSTVTAMTVDSEGTLYVADAQHKPSIQVFDAQGNYLRGWGEHSGGPQNFSLPSGIGLDSVGRILVLDTIRQSITVFTTEGKYLFRFGGLGTAPGSLAYPTGLDVDPAGRLYVTESVNARLQVFELVNDSARTSARPAPAMPSSVREEMRRGLGETLKDIGK
jgi:DNA-binding beta-propeller fold protein YncE